MRSLDLDNPLFQIGLSQSKEQIAIRENELSERNIPVPSGLSYTKMNPVIFANTQEHMLTV